MNARLVIGGGWTQLASSLGEKEDQLLLFPLAAKGPVMLSVAFVVDISTICVFLLEFLPDNERMGK